MAWEEIWAKYRLAVIVGLIGLILLALGILAIFLTTQGQPQIKILPFDSAQGEPASLVTGTILVDLRGAVQNPGVYELPEDSRINDLLIRAGGLAADADRVWLDKNINLAQKLTDGVKIYLPSLSEPLRSPVQRDEVGKININTASAAQLDALWGIGEARAKVIIAGRPYQTVEELITKAKIPKNVFEKIKNEITVY
ncbi:hypothetical protein COT65_01300 [Candidatus Shapirobacteria bacterium CG09_land_8_20_14_0_10_47_13]|uniref:Soluble ligand binding domain-containing protein n=1 Tax=Candidatus Shapirobacteria bacterium CG09_land_8_20_14_0_10_47_13 TaxID=1974481 RepID=A0A2H0WMX1_9BACT|nr:MAG: hypothetical protein COT65_01300 [Candidatus Shapirobacteria bacterium CG09_land_8_20_14_0_10_47_13]